MIIVNSPQKQDEIVELLTNYTDGDFNFEFVKKTGMRMEFKTSATDLDAAAKTAKGLIKSEKWGSVLFFQVVAG
ncbi:hypothetical protein SIN07_08360 [Pediococcus inopinatus]|uniref:Uncharacterized protein n=1 Tax=Pediococcus inopinatus TaxID=114090 RepID=A0ABZ0Q513_9LACO|nr:hypothetical protein [Pediococcus inopinatus]AVK99311.1 hypothetical protein PI20285_00835 [Pediococcus inopinatus]KRN62194.1 hypothetical protein IV83_GL000304 [Pediococcus inopinatus]WPC18259.1 hypothetical protein N6G94_04480 [Pediococcus inopinatus]WPC20352.1 hypothetical protein N6G95_03975 [Pediococcus inopinatus]WPC22056.1 hypothetical protein N6G96_02230 [Pediococcus inopinatus]